MTIATPSIQEPQVQRALVWMRRDLRIDDNAALYHALKAAQQVWCLFVFDTGILSALPRRDRRVQFIHESLLQVHAQLRALAEQAGVRHAAQVGLLVAHGEPLRCLPQWAARLQVQAVYANHDDEPAALARDDAVRSALAEQACELRTYKDHVIFERREVLSATGGAYSVFTPYKNAWLRKADAFFLSSYPVERHASALAAVPPEWAGATQVPQLGQLGFESTNLADLALPAGPQGGRSLWASFQQRISQYHEAREFPAVKGPSYLGPHLRFGTVSVRRLARHAHERVQAGDAGAQTWLSELIWRDFYHQVMHHHPHAMRLAFKPAYEAVTWEKGAQADAHFAAWCEGRTGYPLVDAAMAQINQTGYMHNRLRMVVASFLTKHLGLDWRRGEAYFALHLNDFDLAANNGGWQWAASTGCDAQPYFRIFNPISQSEKFDAQGRFIRRYLPQLGQLPNALIHAPWQARPVDLAAAGVRLGNGPGCNYPLPIVDHAIARATTLQRYAAARA